MIRFRPAGERGHFDHGWLDTRHTFSFADYYDPAHMGFRVLRVINEDLVAPGRGFPMHPHRDMEIITYIVDGALEHKDSMGNGSIIRPGDAQRMSAGTGVFHSEFNPSSDGPVHLLQIWLLPERKGIDPSYEQKSFSDEARTGRLCLLASRDARNGSIRIHQSVDLYAAILAAGATLEHRLESDRHAWLQVVKGSVALNGADLAVSDGAAVSDEDVLSIRAGKDAEILLFDLP